MPGVFDAARSHRATKMALPGRYGVMYRILLPLASRHSNGTGKETECANLGKCLDWWFCIAPSWSRPIRMGELTARVVRMRA